MDYALGKTLILRNPEFYDYRNNPQTSMQYAKNICAIQIQIIRMYLCISVVRVLPDCFNMSHVITKKRIICDFSLNQ